MHGKNGTRASDAAKKKPAPKTEDAVQYPERLGWHSDQSYRRPPPDISLLHCKHPAAAEQGHTLFADCAAAYDALPAELEAAVAGRSILHSNTGMGRTERAVRQQAVHKDPASIRPAPQTCATSAVGGCWRCPKPSKCSRHCNTAHSSTRVLGPQVRAGRGGQPTRPDVVDGVTDPASLAPVAQPIVRLHPVTGRKSLYLVMGQADW